MKTSDDNKKKLTPLEELRVEKAKLKEQCTEKEKYLTSSISYVYHNFGSLFMGTLVSNVGRKIGLVGNKKESDQPIDTDNDFQASSTIRETVMNGLKLTYPVLKPIVLGLVMDKVKGIFTSKKKK